MREEIQKLIENVGKVIIGKEEIVTKILAVLLADGHVLLEDVPGTGKTKLAKALAASLGVEMNRIQFTPDMLPADITGQHIYSRMTERFELKRDRSLPIFCWRMRSTALRPEPSPDCWNVWRKNRSR